MELNYKITNECKEKYIKTNFDTKFKAILRGVMFFISIIMALFSLMALISKDYPFFFFALIVSIAGFYVAFQARILKRRYIKSIDPDNETTIQITDDGVILGNPSRTTRFSYSEIKSIDFVNDYFVFIKFNPGDSAIIPNYAFSNKEEMISFINEIKASANIL